MPSENPTLAAANASSAHQPPKQHPTNKRIPYSLNFVPASYEYVKIPYDINSKTEHSNKRDSALPTSDEFPDLVRAKKHPRAKEIGNEMFYERVSGAEGRDVWQNVKTFVRTGMVQDYVVEGRLGKGKVYIVGLDMGGKGLVGVRKML